MQSEDIIKEDSARFENKSRCEHQHVNNQQVLCYCWYVAHVLILKIYNVYLAKVLKISVIMHEISSLTTFFYQNNHFFLFFV